ncbi:MAG: VWA domain-containing protein [Planctomycetales bacterium]|nr:VWA domain-containing protein [Planctomycetales bacterium]
MAATRKRWLTEGLDLGIDHRQSSPIDFPPPLPVEFRVSADSIVFQGPPPVTESAWGGDDKNVGLFPILDRLDVVTQGSELDRRRKSTGWLGSIFLHVIIVLLVAFLVVPADFAGPATQTLVMTVDVSTPEIPIPMMLVDETLADDSSHPTLEVEQETVQRIDIPLNTGSPNLKITGISSKRGRATGTTGQGTRGSFFGIEASGKDFVYIVDRSGSMNGNRYRRAIDELKRSIGELSGDQRFFVVLFSSSSDPMFGGSQSTEMLNATEDNKKKLEHWLDTIRTGGGTNPNSSLRMAINMNPSAVFMLSDGEFTESKSKRRAGVLESGGVTHSIVLSARGKVPIHAIAFEDPRSCANMKRLAEISGGEYRYVNSMGKTQTQLIAEARALVMRPMSTARKADQDQLSRQFGSSQISAAAKLEFAILLLDEYEALFGEISDSRKFPNQAGLDETIQLLDSMLSIDPHRDVCADQQDLIAGELSRLLHLPQHRDMVEAACDRLVRMPNSLAATMVLDRLAGHFESLNLTEPDKAFARLHLVKMLHPRSEVASVCQSTCDRQGNEIVDAANQLLENGDLAAAIASLRQNWMSQTNGTLRNVTYNALRKMTMDQLIIARNASLRNDFQTKDKINEQLETGFDGDPMLAGWRRELGKQELDARHMLQQVDNGNAFSGLKLKRQQLERIIQQYPQSIAAHDAKEQLKQFPDWQAARDKEEADLIRMMDDTPK